MNRLKKPLIGFLLLFVVFHIILLLMRNEHQVFWHLYTGMMLLSSVGYIYYERNIHSKRLLDAFITGILAGLLIIIMHTMLSFVFKDIHYFHILKTLISLGVYFKWQLVITLLVSIPLQELMIRTMLQDALSERLNVWICAIFVSLAITSLFMYTLSVQMLIFIFIAQMILALSYAHTKRLITSMTAQIIAIILFALIYQ